MHLGVRVLHLLPVSREILFRAHLSFQERRLAMKWPQITARAQIKFGHEGNAGLPIFARQ
jgi:hypothetical protein